MIYLLLLFVGLVEAKEPPPRARIFEDRRVSACQDGSFVHERIKEKEDALYRTRRNCKDQKPERLELTPPRGENVVETQYLISDGKLFVDSGREDLATLLYCQTEGSEQSVKVVLKKDRDAFWLAVSETTGLRQFWSALTVKQGGDTYSGVGKLYKGDSLSLKVRGQSADLTYKFETSPGKLGHRNVRSGRVEGMRCYAR